MERSRLGVSRTSKRDDAGLFQPSYFRVKVAVGGTEQVYPHRVYPEQKVREVKADLEFVTGIPGSLQRLWYLDEADLQDDTDVRHNCIVPNGVLHVSLPDTWHRLLAAVRDTDIQAVFELGVTADSEYTSPNVEFMKTDFRRPQARKQFYAERAFVALFQAAQLGHVDLCSKLVASGARVNDLTPCGRSALHVAAACGHGDVMDILLERGAKAQAPDVFGETPSSLALKFGHKDCDRHLFMFKWQQRAKKAKVNQVT